MDQIDGIDCGLTTKGGGEEVTGVSCKPERARPDHHHYSDSRSEGWGWGQCVDVFWFRRRDDGDVVSSESLLVMVQTTG